MIIKPLIRITCSLASVLLLTTTNISCQTQSSEVSKYTHVVPSSKIYYLPSSNIINKDANMVSNQQYNLSNNPLKINYNDESGNEDLPDFNIWLSKNTYYKHDVKEYYDFLIERLGSANVPPINELLLTARSWENCSVEPYQVPPKYLWENIVPTLSLYSKLKKQNIIPLDAKIRSVYRTSYTNGCAGGATSSKHLINGAIDIWVPSFEFDKYNHQNMQDKMCDFWKNQGEQYSFGLGLYSTGAMHLDTQKYRKWGSQHTSQFSSCRL